MSAGKGEFEQALEQVRRQPGSPAFAVVAEHYLEQNNLKEALRICREGFGVNPSYERGAVVFLTVLRRMAQADTAGEIYGRAVAYLPRSARIRVAWALILADTGKEREARHLAREALDLDPTSAEARALIATLGGTPAPTAAPAWRRGENASGHEEVIEDPSLLEEERPSPPPPRAEVRPWIRPIGQRVTPHAMFDLTPAPILLDPETQRALRDGDAFFDAPSLDEEQQLVDDVTNLDVEVPADLFDDPFFTEKAGAEPVARAAPSKPKDPEEASTSVDHSPPVISGEPKAAKAAAADSSDFIITEDIDSWDPRKAADSAGPIKPQLTPSSFKPSPTQPIKPRLTPSPKAPPPLKPRLTPPALKAPLKPPVTPVDSPDPVADTLSDTANVLIPREFERLEEVKEVAKAPRPRARRLPRWIWIALAAVASAGLVAGGLFLVRHLKDRAFEKKVGEALAQTLPDQLAGYQTARQRLEALVNDRPRDPRATAALALVNAHLWARFAAEDSLRTRARSLLDGPARGGDAAAVAAALLETRAATGRPAGVGPVSPLRPTDARLRWHAQLAVALAALRTGQVSAAEGIFASVLTDKPPAPALLLESATLDRRLGRVDHGEQAVELGLMASPGHVGLRIQQALLKATKGGYTDGDAGVRALQQAAAGVPRYLASVALLRGVLAIRRGDTAAGLRAGQEACRLDPESADAHLQLAAWQLGPGGDAAAALALLDRSCARGGVCGLDRAWALLLLARPHEALGVLGSISAEEAAPQRRRLAELRLRAAHLADDQRAVLQVCGPKAPPPDDPRLRLVCAEALIDRSRVAPAAAMARELEDAAATDLIAGLRALALGDSVKAIARLEKLTKDPVAQIALARAQAKQGNHTKAITTLRKAVELDAGSTRSRVALAQILIAAGHDTEAVATLEAVVEARPTQPALLAAAGEAFLTVGLPGHAASLLKQALKHTAGSVAVQLLAGRVALANQRTADARNHFDELLRREPRNAEALVELGRLDAAEGNGAKARQRFASALKQRPKDPDLLVLLARGHAQTGDYRKAMASGMQAVKLLRQSGQTARAYEVMVELGRVAARGDPWAKTRAEELFFEATKPQNAPAAPFFELGRLHKQKNDPARAVWCFRQALERDPQLADAYLEMGLVMRAKPQWRKEAKKALRHYLQLRPQAKDAAKIKAIVDRMR